MQYIEARIETTPEGIDPVCARLIGLGVDGLQIEDEADFLAFLRDSRKYWDYVDEELLEAKKGVCCIKIYLEDNRQGREMLSQVKEGLAALKADLPELNLGSLAVITGSRDEGEWAEAWKQYYQPMEIGKRLYIRPEWVDAPCPPGRAELVSNPGMAFGTGTHASTYMCLQAVDEIIRGGERVLDLGCGSGILGIAALLLGAQSCTAVDIDEGAVQVSRKNAGANGVGARFDALSGDVLADKALFDRLKESRYDLIMANIVADVIIALCGKVRPLLNGNGRFLVSGIIDTRAGEVKASLDNAGFVMEKEYTSGGWHAMLLMASLQETEE